MEQTPHQFGLFRDEHRPWLHLWRSRRSYGLQDIENGKKTEVDAINGAIAAFGDKIGFPTPLNRKVTLLIHRIEKGELTPGFDNLRFF